MRYVQTRIWRIVRKQLGLDDLGREIALKARFAEDLGSDPVAVAQLVLAVEEQLDIEISNEDAEGFRSAQDVIDHVAARLSKARTSSTRRVSERVAPDDEPQQPVRLTPPPREEP
jgi:acyl carrier protein